jgi:hypothetical protein
MSGEPLDASTRELLAWASSGRSYAELTEAWSSWCPRHSTWEDALAAGLVRIVREPGAGSRVVLTDDGRAALA